MIYLAVIFLAFSMSISWVSGDKQKDKLSNDIREGTYINKTMEEQVRQSKLKASRDASRIGDLTVKLSAISKANKLAARKLNRAKARRARLLRPQIAKIKEKVEAPYKTKLSKMEKEIKTAKADLAKLKAENEKLKREYEQLIQGQRSDERNPIDTPFTEENSTNEEIGVLAKAETYINETNSLQFEDEGFAVVAEPLQISKSTEIPASKDLVSTDEILKADETRQQPAYLSIEDSKLNEGWL